MLGTTTPLEITEAIVNFCAEIDPTQTPLYINPTPDPNAILSECFTNVREHVQSYGGSLQLGWIIWETADILLEAMFHAVWRSTSGELVDVTPQMDGETRILFLPDSTATLENDSGDVVAMRRKALVDDPIVHEFIRLGDWKDAVKVRTNGMMTLPDVREYANIEMKQLEIQKQLASKYRGKIGELQIAPVSLIAPPIEFTEPVARTSAKVGRNDRCPCGSGKKYKKCCLR